MFDFVAMISSNLAQFNLNNKLKSKASKTEFPGLSPEVVRALVHGAEQKAERGQLSLACLET